MASASYTLGAVIRLTFTIKVGGVLTDPSTLTLKVRPKGGATLTYTYAGGQVTRSSQGVYYKDFTPTTVGDHVYYVQTTGTAAGAEKRYFTVVDDEVD